MHFWLFYFAVFCLGATMGALHALSLSPLSAAVLQILGTIAVGAIGVLASNNNRAPSPVRLRQTLPALTAVTFAVLIGYWSAWWATKEIRIYHYNLPVASMPKMTPQQELDAYRLIGLGRALGIPRNVIEARITELLNGTKSTYGRALTSQEEIHIVARLAQDSGNCVGIAPEEFKPYLTDIAGLREDAEKLIIRVQEDNWVRQFLNLRANALIIPLPPDAPSFTTLMEAAGCNTGERAMRQFAALDQSLGGRVSSIEGEIQRLLSSAPEISTPSILRNPGVENENFK